MLRRELRRELRDIAGLNLAVLLGGVFLNMPFVGSANAHHGTAVNYDRDSIYMIEGIVTEFSWRNPHSALYVDVLDKDGNTVNYAIELTSPVMMARSSCGWTPETFKPGDRIEFPVNPSRVGAPVGLGMGQCEEVLVNGKQSNLPAD